MGGEERAGVRASLLWVAALWLALVAIALAFRPLLPVDETRYAAVAWEMWQRGDFLVPHLNGEPYSHKPPFLFWLIHMGWAVGGVSDTWARLVGPLAGLVAVVLVPRLARTLWPADAVVRGLAPLALMACGAWAVMTTMTMFDTLLTVCVLVGLWGVAGAARGQTREGWGLFAIALAAGLLAKGPVILIHLLPVPLLAPLWASFEGRPPWPRWYRGLGLSVLLGAAIALAWALPAGLAGGADYRDAILWGQSAGRVVDAFAHGRPWWWYMAALPPALLPLLVWPGLWRALRQGWRQAMDPGVRFCLTWLAGSVGLASLVSGKQIHYLLPELPAIALLAAFFLARAGADAHRRWDLTVPGALVGIVGIAIAVAPLIPLSGRSAVLIGDVAGPWGLAVAALGASVALLVTGGAAIRLATVAAITAGLVCGVHLAVAPMLAQRFDLAPLTRLLGQWERAGRPLANYGAYHGQYHFLGRLTAPLAIIGDGEIVAWTAANPQGIIVTYQDRVPEGGEPLFVQPFRRGLITVWEAADAAREPRLVRRPPDP